MKSKKIKYLAWLIPIIVLIYYFHLPVIEGNWAFLSPDGRIKYGKIFDDPEAKGMFVIEVPEIPTEDGVIVQLWKDGQCIITATGSGNYIDKTIFSRDLGQNGSRVQISLGLNGFLTYYEPDQIVSWQPGPSNNYDGWSYDRRAHRLERETVVDSKLINGGEDEWVDSSRWLHTRYENGKIVKKLMINNDDGWVFGKNPRDYVIAKRIFDSLNKFYNDYEKTMGIKVPKNCELLSESGLKFFKKIPNLFIER